MVVIDRGVLGAFGAVAVWIWLACISPTTARYISNRISGVRMVALCIGTDNVELLRATFQILSPLDILSKFSKVFHFLRLNRTDLQANIVRIAAHIFVE